MMKHLRLHQRILSHRFCDSASRYAALGSAVIGLLLTAPLLERREQKREPQHPAPAAPEPPPRVGVTLTRGDTLLSVLRRSGLTLPSAHGMVEKVRPLLNLRKLRPGHSIQLVLHPQDNSVQGMEVILEDSLVRVKATTEGWSAERHDIPFVRETRVVRGAVTDSLYQSGVQARLTPQQILDLARIFEYDIDFFSDFQPRDVFAVAVEEIRYADGRRGAGRILAAELEADGNPFSAFYFVAQDRGGAYYDGEGRAARRPFLRAPLSYVRISSPFNLSRRHPILRTVRPHRAIDYAAPEGTPVVAIGRGRVEFAGWRDGYGKMVEIRHSGGYMSRYAHFSRFGMGMRQGKPVDEGDVVGYVGQTGHATGPHLHFEFLRGGEKINFLAFRIPKSERLAEDDLQRFKQMRDRRQALLRSGKVEVAVTEGKGL